MEPDVEQAWSNQAIVRPTPGVQNTICVITRSLIAMIITDIISCAALVCSRERVRKRSRNSKNAPRN